MSYTSKMLYILIDPRVRILLANMCSVDLDTANQEPLIFFLPYSYLSLILLSFFSNMRAIAWKEVQS
jgi:hypothetical protein